VNAGYATFNVISYQAFEKIITTEHRILGRKIICRQFLDEREKK
jgi:hypothetical protein